MSGKPLQRLRYPQEDLFLVDGLDFIIKDDMPSMEHPFYSLSKNPDLRTRRYNYNDKWIEFRPSIKGLPTIYDKDLIIYAISCLVASFEPGEEIPKEVEINPNSFLIFTNRGRGGRDYDALVDSLDRLHGSNFRTNIVFEGKRTDEWQGIIDKARLVTNEKTNKPEKMYITLSDMVLDNIKQRKVLTLNRDYFRLTKPIARRIYEICRKHMGNEKNTWSISLGKLHEKSGSRAVLKEFRRAVKSLEKENNLPDFRIEFSQEDDIVKFYSKPSYRDAFSNPSLKKDSYPVLQTTTYERAQKILPNVDIYTIEKQWHDMWDSSGRAELKNPDAAFLGYCNKIKES